MSPGIPDLLWPAFRGRRAAFMAGGIVSLVLCVWLVVAAVQVAIEGYDGGIYVPQSACPDGMPDRATCERRYQERQQEERTEAAVRDRLGMATVPLAFVLLFGALWWRVRNPGAPGVTRAIVASPGDVVWIYSIQTSYRRHGREVSRDQQLTICTARSQTFALPMPEIDVRRALAGLAEHLPHATFGFSPEKQALFQRDPASLRRSPVSAGVHVPAQAAQPGQVAMPGQAGMQHMEHQPPPQRSGWLAVAPHVPFPHIDHALRSIGLGLESTGPLVGPGEPGGAAWSAPWARVTYRWDAATRSRVLELFAQDVPALHARLAATGLPIAGPQQGR